MTVGAHQTVVVAALTYKRPDMLRQLLESLLTLEPPTGWDVRFLIVDNDAEASAKPTVESFASRFGTHQLDYAVEPEPGIPAARNRALDEASNAGARLLCFLDDDEYPDAAWLRELVAHHEATGAVLVGGPCIVTAGKEPESAWRRFVARSIVERNRFMRKHYDRLAAHGGPAMFSTDNCLIDLDWMRAKGLRFDPALRFTGSSDTALWLATQRLGGKVSWCSSAVVHEALDPDRVSLRYQFRRSISNGITSVYLSPERAWRAVPRQVVKIASGLGLVAIPVFGTASLMLGVRRIGMGVGCLAGLCGARSNLYERRPESDSV